MQFRRLLQVDSRNAAIGGGFLVALATLAILAPTARAGLVTPQPPKPILPQAVTSLPAPSSPAAPTPPPSSSSSTSGSPAQPANGPASNQPSQTRTSPPPHGPPTPPDYPSGLEKVGDGCDIGCLEGWAAYEKAYLKAYGALPLSEYNESDYLMVQWAVAAFKAIKEEIGTALITGAHATLTDALPDSCPSYSFSETNYFVEDGFPDSAACF